MRLDTSLLDGISAAKHAAKSSSSASQKSSGSSFTSALKAATSDASKTEAAETTQAVPGHAYAEILSGSRAGMYLNTSHNKRSGEAFVMVHRNGVELHVYGTGKNRHVVEMKRHSTPAPAPGTTAPTPAPATTTPTPATSNTGAGKITVDTSTVG